LQHSIVKKVLLIVGLSFLLANNSFAGCKKNLKLTMENTGNEIILNFKNNGSKHVRITSVRVDDADGDKIIKINPTSYNYSNSGSNGIFVLPNKRRSIKISSRSAAQYGKMVYWDCSYQKPYETSIGDKADNAAGAVSDFFGDLFKKDKNK